MDFILFLLAFVGLCGWLDNWASTEPSTPATEVMTSANETMAEARR